MEENLEPCWDDKLKPGIFKGFLKRMFHFTDRIDGNMKAFTLKGFRILGELCIELKETYFFKGFLRRI